MPLVFQPGETFQFDWSEDYAVIGGERTKLQVAHMKLAHSRAFLLRGYLLQSHEMLFDAHWHGFRVFGGVPARGIYDSEEDQPLIRWINGPTNAHGGGPGRARQAASGQRPVHGDDQPLRVRADLLSPNEATMRQLHKGSFLDAAENVAQIRGPGTGKTHVATAIGIQLIEHHRRSRRTCAAYRRSPAS